MLLNYCVQAPRTPQPQSSTPAPARQPASPAPASSAPSKGVGPAPPADSQPTDSHSAGSQPADGQPADSQPAVSAFAALPAQAQEPVKGAPTLAGKQGSGDAAASKPPADAGKPADVVASKPSADAGKPAADDTPAAKPPTPEPAKPPMPEAAKQPMPPRVSFSKEASAPSESGKHRHEEPSPRDTSSNRAQVLSDLRQTHTPPLF